MIITENWLRHWIDLKLDTDGLVEALTMAGLEVDSIQSAGPALEQVVVGKIIEVSPHPQATRLKLCRVEAGGGEILNIVCGAPNARAGLYAPLALVGAVLPAGAVIEQSTIRGVTSSGMLCSARELALGDAADGLLELDDDARPGQSLHEYLMLADSVIEIDLTPNRGDCLSILGVARELSVLTGARLKHKNIPGWREECDAAITINIDSPQNCPRYIGRVMTSIDATASTPCWMRERLRRCGVRPISPVVDVTNYVMLELGQPMHAFDRDRLNQGIFVRQAELNEEIDLLDGSRHSLSPETLVIADAAGAIAIAGVMGGGGSAVSEHTRNIVLEAAFFSPSGVAGQARRYALHTDASHRFERGVDPTLPYVASHYATSLLKSITGGVPGPVVEAVHKKYLPKRRPVVVRHERTQKVLGMAITASKMNVMLNRVGSKVRRSAGQWRVTPPSYRFDIERECDLIEEIARVSGYDAVPVRTPRVGVSRVDVVETRMDPLRLKQNLVDHDYREVLTYSFVDPDVQSRLMPEEQGIALRNPLASNLSVMRVSLWPGLMQALSTNLNRQHRRVRLFEMGKTFHRHDREHVEVERISGIASGTVWPEQWGESSREIDFFDVKSDLEALFGLTQEAGLFSFHAATHPALHPGQSAEIRRGTDAIGWAGRLHPEQQRALELSQAVYLFELEVSALTHRKMPEYRGISRFPAIRRDLAVLVDEHIPAGELLKSIENIVGEDLTNLELFDVYRREGVDSKRKSLAFSLTLQASSRTLIDSEVESIISRTLDELRRRYGAELRT